VTQEFLEAWKRNPILHGVNREGVAEVVRHCASYASSLTSPTEGPDSTDVVTQRTREHRIRRSGRNSCGMGGEKLRELLRYRQDSGRPRVLQAPNSFTQDEATLCQTDIAPE
jgi:hypothetical protein